MLADSPPTSTRHQAFDTMLNETHDPALTSWVPSAQRASCDFPIQNLPHGVFRRRGETGPFRGGVAIGDQVLDLQQALAAGVFPPSIMRLVKAASRAELNEFMALGPRAWHEVRLALSKVLRSGAPEAEKLQACLVPQFAVEHAVPARIGDYTDFFTSWHHMVNAGRIFQPDAPPLPNFRWLPIAYHGRASTVGISDSPVYRPSGQRRIPPAQVPEFGPTMRLDYEFELAAWVGVGNKRGEPISVGNAEEHIFGVSLLNDWSARDVQAWEAMPLGPFLAKNFLTTVSPWIVTWEALAPYRCALPRTSDDPPELPNLASTGPSGIDIHLEASLVTERSGNQELHLSRSNFRHCYWSIPQMVAHHTENGCSLQPGDLLGTGTQSGPSDKEQGCLLELSQGGKQPVHLGNGETRTYLQDGDTVVLRAWAEIEGAARVGFGECRGTVQPSAV